MHEMSLMNSLVSQVHQIASREGASRVLAVKVRLGALAHMSPEHFREHFNVATRGSIAGEARLDIETSDNQQDPDATGIINDTVEIEKD